MDYLRIGNHDYAFKLLKKAENLLVNPAYNPPPSPDAPAPDQQQRARLVSLTMNNLGCYYKKYLKKSLLRLEFKSLTSHSIT